MSRSVPPLLLALTLVTGMLVGVLLDRRGTTIEAAPQQGQGATAPPPAGPSTSRTPRVPAVRTGGASRATPEDAAYEQLAKQYAAFEAVNKTFETVARVVSPAVVHIVAEKVEEKNPRLDSSRVKRFEETGSGVIIRGDNGKGVYVLTNNHVVEGAQPAKINIYLHDGRVIRPDQVWLDPMADIAVLNLNRDDLFSLRFGNSDDMAVGSWVIALGSPFGLTHSVSQGIISARGRHMDELEDVKNQDFLQTDAAINPGNSGGPLVNMKGEVIGINNSIASNGGGNEGVAFSIPSNIARWIMNELIKKGKVSRGALGIDLRPEFRPDDATRLGLDRPKGAWVSQVYPASPASIGGLRDGDVILQFQGLDITDYNHFINMVSMAPIGRPAELIIWRDKQRYTLHVTVGDRDQTMVALAPPDPAAAERAPSRGGGGPIRRPNRPETNTGYALGIQLQTLDEAAARRLGLPSAGKGAIVVKLEPESPLLAILQPNDLVYSVDGRPVGSAEDAVRAINGHSGNDELQLGYDRVVKGAIERRTVRVP